MASPFEVVCSTAFKDTREFVQADGIAWWVAVSLILYFYEALIGAGELAQGKEDGRLTSLSWWIRQLFIQGSTGLFLVTGVKFAENICTFALAGFGDALVNIVSNGFNTMLQSMEGAQHMTMANLMNKTFMMLSGASLVEAASQMLGMVLSIIIGCLCLLFVIFQAYLAIGCSAFTCCLGPICIPFGASSATQDIALGWLKMFLVYCVLYTPLLAVALQIAGDCMTQSLVTQIMASAHGQSMIFDIFEGIITNLATPFAMLGFVIAVPHIVSKALR